MGILYLVGKIKNKKFKFMVWFIGLLLLIYSLSELFQIVSLLLR